ncbi:MAG TPA: hypothetical protein VNR64_07625 [Vicinamibacterales bacterium]|nr:hypothetical protein [Vicinamibacterales bacterium]
MGKATRETATPPTRMVVCVKRGLTVVAGEAGRMFAPGDVVTLDAELAPGLTWADAIGVHVDEHFTPVTTGAEGA